MGQARQRQAGRGFASEIERHGPARRGAGQRAAVDKRGHLGYGEAGGRAQAVFDGKPIARERAAFIRRKDRDDRRQLLRDLLRLPRPREPVRLGDGLVLVEVVQHALHDVGPVELVAEARGGKEIRRVIPVAVHVPADQILRAGRGGVIALRRPSDIALVLRVHEQREQLLARPRGDASGSCRRHMPPRRACRRR